jgi:phosphatidylinositol alpha 1,6-mannosyltransferase
MSVVPRVPRLAAGALLLALAACGTGGTASTAGPGPQTEAGAPQVYVAVGASETVGAGIEDDPLRLRDAWPQLFYNAALPRSSTYYNLGVDGETTAGALAEQVPRALALQPTVVTVWLNVDDLVHGVSAADYESNLGAIVHQLRRGGAATVLVANTPSLDRLPAYLACRPNAPGGVGCLLGPQASLPDAATVNSLVDAYNGAAARVVAREGAVLVDLHAQGEIPDTHPEWIATDGFHPSAAGHAAAARLFVAAYVAAMKAPA